MMYILTITDNHEEREMFYFHRRENAIERACAQYYLGEHDEYKEEFLARFRAIDDETVIDDGYVRLEVLHTED